MRVKWSRHAHNQRMGIVRLIFREQTREIASRWNQDFGETARLLPPFPELGDRIRALLSPLRSSPSEQIEFISHLCIILDDANHICA